MTCITFRRGGVIALCASALMQAPSAVNAFIEDVTPPALAALSINPTAVDTTAGPAVSTVRARITDDLSGLNYAYASFVSPSGQQSQSAYLRRPPVSGTPNDGEFEGLLTVPQNAEAGTWTIQYVYLLDLVGNSTRIFTDDLRALGFPTDLEVISAPDTSAPELQALSFTPESVETISGPALVTMTAHISDAGAGLSYGYAFFVSPSGQQNASAYFRRPPLSGTENDGEYIGELTLPQFCEGGTWTIQYFYLLDQVGNSVSIWTADLRARGFRTDLLVTSAEDTAPPTLLEFDFSPKFVDTSNAPAAVPFTARIADDISGLAYGYADFVSPSGQQVASVYFRNPPVTGTINDGRYEGILTLPQYCEEGTWTLQYIYLLDTVRNFITIWTPEMESLRFPTQLEVGRRVVDIGIDIKPESAVNSVNAGSKGTIPVAILGSAQFDVASLDTGTLTFGRTGAEPSLARCNPQMEDVNRDGRRDRICHFHTPAAGFRSGDTRGFLKGLTSSGTPVQGSDSVRIVP